MAVVDQIEAGDESGSVTIGPKAYLGIGVADPAAARVAQVEAGGPAADAGLAAGDTITALGDTQITSYDVLVDTLATYEPGDQVTLEWTDASGASHSATVTLGESPRTEPGQLPPPQPPPPQLDPLLQEDELQEEDPSCGTRRHRGGTVGGRRRRHAGGGLRRGPRRRGSRRPQRVR